MLIISTTRLEEFQTKHELARNFYDDYEFCPLYTIEEVAEHRERIQRRTSPNSPSTPSPTCQPIRIIDPKTMALVTIKPQRPTYPHPNHPPTKQPIRIINPKTMTPVFPIILKT